MHRIQVLAFGEAIPKLSADRDIDGLSVVENLLVALNLNIRCQVQFEFERAVNLITVKLTQKTV